MKENRFYVYAHYKPNETVPFYIGKGCGKRAWIKSKGRRSDYWINIVNKYGLRVELLQENLTEEESFKLEIEYIQFYGREDLKTGPLINTTDGGEGPSGHIHSEETRKKISKAGKGHITSEETKRKISVSERGKIISEKTRKKLSEVNKGQLVTIETRKKMSISRIGKKHWNFGNPYNRQSPFKGKKHSEETRKKMSESAKFRKHLNGA